MKTTRIVISVLLQALIPALLLTSGCTGGGNVEAPDATDAARTLAEGRPEDVALDEIAIHILHAGGACNGMTYLNAQEPFEAYYAAGYRYFEYDLMLSSDGRLIGSHGYQHLEVPDGPLTYKAFKSLRLPGGLTPVNEEWLVETLRTHPELCIVVDAKMDTTEGDVAVLARMEALEAIHGIDLSARIIPEIFSVEMWAEAQACTSFDRYLFSHYKEYYSVDTMLEHFSAPAIWGVAVPTWSDNYIKSNLYKLRDAGKRLFVFTVTNEEELALAREIGAYGIYVNDGDIVGGATDAPGD